jgi:RNA polymerase sigma-B factor
MPSEQMTDPVEGSAAGEDTEPDVEQAKVPASDHEHADAAAPAVRASRQPRRRTSSRGKLAWDKERTREQFRRYKELGDEDAREELIVSHLNLVRYLASKFKNRGESLDDLVQVGTIGLIKAIDRFDPSRGLEFTTYATPTILGEIKRHFRDKGWSVRVPRRLQELSAKVNQTTDSLTKELQRSPTVDEIAEALDVSVDEVLEAMESSSAYSSVPLEGGGMNDDDAPSVLDRYATEDEALVSSDDRMVIEDAIKEFSPREQEVIRMRFVEGLTQVEIADKLGVSQVQVSRLLRRTLKKVQEKIDPEGLMDR